MMETAIESPKRSVSQQQDEEDIEMEDTSRFSEPGPGFQCQYKDVQQTNADLRMDR